MPAQHVAGLGPKGGLMQLASEAVRAAAQSPFLERAVGRATAVLCCVYLPDRGLPSPGAVCLRWQCCSWKCIVSARLLCQPTGSQCPLQVLSVWAIPAVLWIKAETISAPHRCFLPFYSLSPP